MVEKPTDILIVDDEPEIREILQAALSNPQYRCATAENGAQAYDLLIRKPFDIILSDIAMPELDGLELLAKARILRPEVKVILITGFGSLEWAKQAIRQGAFDYLEKPFELEDVRLAVGEARSALRAKVGRISPSDLSHDRPLRDGLTGLVNHRTFCEELTRLRSACRRYSRPLSILLLDVDHFGRINDDYGHAVGDLLLRELGERLVESCRNDDLVARYGWDQFAVALPETDIDEALPVARRCCRTIQESPIRVNGLAIPCSVSSGLAECETGFIESEADLLRRAQNALTHAKMSARGEVVCWPIDRGANRDDGNRTGDRKWDAIKKVWDIDAESLREIGEQMYSLQAQLRQTCLESTRALVAAVEAKEPLTERHSLNVATYCEAIARRLDVRAPMIETIKIAATLHDIGKIGVPDAVLNKPGKLTDEEFALIKQHPSMGVRILERASFLHAELPIILHHHERWDGQGYPAGLAGTCIPLGARILHVADSMDAMFSRRTYKDGYPVERVIAELRGGMGTQFDPQVVEAALAWLAECPDEIVRPTEAADSPCTV